MLLEALGLGYFFLQNSARPAILHLNVRQSFNDISNRALRRLTSEVRRDPVYSIRYGRQRGSHVCVDVRKREPRLNLLHCILKSINVGSNVGASMGPVFSQWSWVLSL